ncbi:MAG: hypothetical protein ACXU9U_02225, partial [Parachlamydiaceae bacterium]
IRKVQKFLGKIKRVIHQNRHQYGDISNKKFTLYCDNGKIFVKLTFFFYGEFRHTFISPILIQD